MKSIKVSLFFIILVISCRLGLGNYFNLLGLKAVPNGKLLLFDYIYKINLNLDLDLRSNEKPSLLDCAKYDLSKLERKKRQVFSNFEAIDEEKCLFNSKKWSNDDYSYSADEETHWQNFVKNASQVFCARGYATTCLLRRVVLPRMTITWTKRYALSGEYISREHTFYWPDRKLTEFKEIYYQNRHVLQLARENKPIILPYNCLPIRFQNIKPDYMIELEEEYKINVLDKVKFSNEKIVIKSPKSEDYPISKYAVINKYKIINETFPITLQPKFQMKYLEGNDFITQNITLLNKVESQINDLITESDEQVSINYIQPN